MKILNEDRDDDKLDLVKSFIPKDRTPIKQVSIELEKMGASIWSFRRVNATIDGQTLEIRDSSKNIEIDLNIYDAKDVFKKRKAVELVYTGFAVELSF